MRTWRTLALLLLALALVLLGACQPSWQCDLLIGGETTAFTAAEWRQLAADFPDEAADGVALERVLWEHGTPLVETVMVDGQVLDWRDETARQATWLRGGELRLGALPSSAATLRPRRVEAVAPSALAAVQASILDIAPTAMAALGLPAPAASEGRPLTTTPAAHVALIFLDGFGYLHYQRAAAAGDVPHLAALGAPLLALTMYPSATKVATAAMLTGAPPARNGVRDTSTRSTELETIFDIIQAKGRHAAAIEGYALAFNLRNVSLQLSSDQDGDGSSDDEVLANALAVVGRGMPALLFVHWHGIDDLAHTYGPASPEVAAKVREVDAHVGQLVAALPTDTLVIIFADHGQHAVQEEGRLGNHGSLLPEDMLIPIILYRK